MGILASIFKVGQMKVSFLGRKILWGSMNSVVLSLLSYMRNLLWLSLSLQIILVILEKFQNYQELDLWPHDCWAQNPWACFPVTKRCSCKPMHFTLLTYVSTYLSTAKIGLKLQDPGLWTSYLSTKIQYGLGKITPLNWALLETSTFQSNEIGQELVLIPDLYFI